MAHQAHNIPWQLLASHFRYSYANPKCDNTTDLVLTWKAGQGKDITHFLQRFVSILKNMLLKLERSIHTMRSLVTTT